MSSYEDQILTIETIANEIMDTTMQARIKHSLSTCDAACVRAIVEKTIREMDTSNLTPPEAI